MVEIMFCVIPNFFFLGNGNEGMREDSGVS
jgi:hypothetical protein